MRTVLIAALLLGGCKGCNDEPVPAEEADSVVLDVPQTSTQRLPGLTSDVQVLFNSHGVPTVFGENEADVALVHGYLIARDRYFILDLSRRLGLGNIASLVGQDGLESDLESRQRGLTHVADLMLAELDDAPVQAAYIDGYAAGINAYIEQVQSGALPPPAELALLAPLLGVEPVDVMQPFDRRDIAAGMAFIVFETAWEPGDVNRAADAARLPGLFDGAPLGDLRQAGLRPDVFDRVIPAVSVGSAVDWVPGAASPWGPPPDAPPPAATDGGGRAPTPTPGMLERLQERLHSAATRMGKDREAGFGSNAWTVSSGHTASGSALLAADPHLPLSIPSVMWQVGLDTRELGGGDLHVVGHQIAAFPYMASGTNGDIAWGQTNTGGGDITDWYAEQITLDANGAPASSLFDGAQQPLVITEDTYEIAAVAALGSAGGSETIARYATFDGRWITSIEGRSVAGPEEAGPGETAVNMMGDWIVPEDVDGVDGITAVSFDYVGFDMGAMMRAADGIVKAPDLAGFVDITRDFVAYGLQIVAADSTGSILYTPFMAMPCRGYLDRNPDGSFAEGADPRMLLDGTRYGGFEIPADA
ncbi:MAG: penicillin amidase, partial [Myxococcota bacterium]